MRQIHNARIDDLMMIGSWLCESDRQELSATRDPDDYEGLAWDAWGSQVCKVAVEETQPVFAFGAKPMGDTALVWGFKTERGWSAIRSVTKYIQKTMIPELRSIGIRRAVCLVHPANARSQRWLTHLGFAPRATLQGLGSQEMFLFQRDELDAYPQ